MEIDRRKVIIAATLFAFAGIAVLFYLSGSPKEASVAEALVAPQNAYLKIVGTASNITESKFSLCSARLCISVKKGSIVQAHLAENGKELVVFGRVREYRGSRYIEAERIEAWKVE